MKSIKRMYWVSTVLIFLFQGVMPALTSQTEPAKEGIRHLGYPGYFGTLLTICKVLGAIVLIMPQASRRVKEWAYAGFAFDFIFAFVSLWCVDGLTGLTFFPILVFAVLIISYICFHKINPAVKTIQTY